MNFDDIFKAATGHRAGPFDFQRRLACGERRPDEAKAGWLRHGTGCESRLISIPTGLGKTAAVVLAWLWNRLLRPLNPRPSTSVSAAGSPAAPQPSLWPRRLVYCLPMRTLVEQTAESVKTWLRNLRTHAGELGLGTGSLADLDWLTGHSPVILMGGEPPSNFGLSPSDLPWDVHPEKPCLLIGTQDMLLSRALNRGYGMSRYRWPMHFGLLNNDCLWVMDETQLMGVGVETSAQLDAFRLQFATAGGSCRTWWMSATLDKTRLTTVDRSKSGDDGPDVELETEDLDLRTVKDRFEAKKSITPASVSLSRDTRKTYASQLARFISEHHQPDSLTLVVVNRVDRAQEVYQQLLKLKPSARLSLIHARFRPGDRQQHETALHAEGSRIVIATQAVEAGVDVSACTLITELAPWSSMVQRCGRCNRRGEFKQGEARVWWVDVRPMDEGDDLARPYTGPELQAARNLLHTLQDAGPATMQSFPPPPEPPMVRPVLRCKDLVELFDTTPDLAGHDLDISRFVRDGDDTDVQVFWRDLGDQPPSPDEPEPARAELCRVSLPRFRAFLDKPIHTKAKTGMSKPVAYVWNPLADQWEPAPSARPGASYLLDVRAGGYSADLGWVGPARLDHPITPLTPANADVANSYAGDPATFSRAWITLADHSRAVGEEATRIASVLAPDLVSVFLAAAQWHDVGKAHEAFQKMLRGDDPARSAQLWAKSGQSRRRCERRSFRHELASALAWLHTSGSDAPERDLVAYLIAAHHGKVRLSLRSLPGEEPPPDRPDARLARGILDGDPLGPVELDGLSLPAITLDLSLMEIGWDAEREPQRGPSWLARMITLRDRFGPFRLAWLETLLRAADARASAAAGSLSLANAEPRLSP